MVMEEILWVAQKTGSVAPSAMQRGMNGLLMAAPSLWIVKGWILNAPSYRTGLSRPCGRQSAGILLKLIIGDKSYGLSLECLFVVALDQSCMCGLTVNCSFPSSFAIYAQWPILLSR